MTYQTSEQTSMVSSELRELLEEKTGILLLIAGGLLLPNIAVRNLRGKVEFSIPELLPGWAGVVFSTSGLAVVGLAIPFVALLGLYYRFTSETPRVAVAGGALMALTPVLLVSGLLSMLVPALPDVPNLTFLSPLPYMVGVGLFGLAFFRKSGSVRFAGVPLLAFSGTWALLYATDGWVPFVELLAVSLLATGYLLYTDPTTRNDAAPA